MATTRKILSKAKILEKPVPVVEKIIEEEIKTDKSQSFEEDNKSKSSVLRPKKYCQFCANKTEPYYFDAVSLRRFINDRGRIVARIRSGACSKHQRRITKEIKRARHMALLPFTVKV